MSTVTERTPTGARAGLLWVVGGFGCLSCVLPAAVTALGVVGLSAVAMWMHNIGLALVPLVILLLWHSSHQHGRRMPLLVGLAGGAMLAAHAVTHVVPFGAMAFTLTNVVGTGLLATALVGNLVAARRWTRTAGSCRLG